MKAMTDFEAGDRVLARVAAYVLEDRGDTILLSTDSRTLPPMDVRFVADRDAVEFVFRPDDPSKDPVGTVRHFGGRAFVLVEAGSGIAHDNLPWICVTSGGANGHYTMRGSEKLAPVPGTPADDQSHLSGASTHKGGAC